MNKLLFTIVLLLCMSCKMNTSSKEEVTETVNSEEVGPYDQSPGMQILGILGKVYGNEPHIFGLSLETPNCPEFIEGIYFDKADLFFQVSGDTVKARQILEEASGSSNFKLEWIDEESYSHKRLLVINDELIAKLKTLEDGSLKRNFRGAGVGRHYIDIDLIVNTPEKRKEFREKIMDSPAFRFNGVEVPVVNEKRGVNDTLGIYIRPEYPVYSTEAKSAKFILYNQSGTKIDCGEAYFITFEDEKGIWRELPINDFFNAVGYVVNDKGQRVKHASLFPDLHPNKPGRYRFFYEVSIEGQRILMMAEFSLTSDEEELKAAEKTPLPGGLKGELVEK